MASKNLTEYERKRLENIKRNEELLASLKLHSKAADLSAATKRQRAQTSKSYKVSPEKKLKSETPIVIRRSLRTQGKSPDSATAGGLKDDFDETQKKSRTFKSQISPKKSPRELGEISMRDACTSSESDGKLAERILGVCKESQLSGSDTVGDGSENKGFGNRVRASIDLESMELEPENIARVVPGRIMTIKFFPTTYMTMVVVGNKLGNVGFWNVDSENEDGNGIYMYYPHSGPVSGVSVHPLSMSKIVTSCYDGFIRSLDVEKETFGLAYSSDTAIFSLSQRSDDVSSLYFGEGPGVLRNWDERSGKSSLSWSLHENRINTIDFNSQNTNIMATSSTDGTACIWDLRNLSKSKPKSLKMVNHKRAVHSAYFSPSGSLLATTSLDDKIGLLSGENYDDESMIYHYNQTGRWISSFRAIWGWDDSYIFVGNMKRGVDVISADERKLVTTIQSPHMTAIPCRFDAHPLKAGMLAGATSGGQVYIWNS